MSSEADSPESQPHLTVDHSPKIPKLDESDNASEAESIEEEGPVKTDNSSNKRSDADETAVNVDIVAVHGLLPTQSTFEDDIKELTDNGSMGKWIRYKFNPNLTFSKRGFNEAALGLLREISNSRQGTQRKKHPIVFLSHDIGGSIVKRALYLASQDAEFYHIAYSTKMLVINSLVFLARIRFNVPSTLIANCSDRIVKAFFGHPHRSLCLPDMEDKISRLVFSDPVTTPRNVTACICNLASNVSESNILFLETKVLLHAELLNVYSQQETVTEQIFDKYTSTMELGFEKVVASSKPHKELTKDASATMAEMVQDIKISYYGLEQQTQHRRELVRDMIVHLSPPICPLGILPNESHQLDSLVRHEKFIDWAHSPSSGILTINVDPRWSVLREYLFRYIIRTKKNNDLATTFSFDNYDARFRSVDAFLHSTAAQWISYDRSLLEMSNSKLEYQRYKEDFEAYNTMDAMALLLKLHAFNEAGSHFFVLENDNDCPEMDTVFWPRVLHVMNIRERPWKFLLLRHSTRSISGWLSKWPRIQVSEEDVASIMDSAAEGSLISTTPVHLNDTDVSQWKDCIANCGRDVRKASLAIRLALASSTASLLEGDDLLPQFKEQMNKDISEIMEDILQRIPRGKRPPLEDLMGLILVAKRPLNHAELRDISHILYQTRYASVVDLSFTDDIFKHLESNLPGVFDFTYGEVRLQHPEIRTFFLPLGDAKPKIDQPDAEKTLAQICMRYIQDSSFVGISEKMSSHRMASQPPICSTRDNLADYAVRYWHEHMREALKKFPSEEDHVLQFFQDDSVVRSLGRALHAVSNPVIEDQEIELSPLALIACTDLKLTAKQWMKDNETSPQVQAALTKAIKAGNLEVANVLLEYADLKEAPAAESVLLAASSLGNEEFSISLLATVLKSCPHFKWHPRLIGRAAWLGQDKLVRLMIEKQAPLDVNVHRRFGPLELSARNNNAAVMELLLAHSPDLINRKLDDNQVFTALHLAAHYGYTQIIEMLIQSGADKNMKGTFRPIMIASVYGNFSAVRTLLKAGAEPEWDELENAWSPLSGAVSYGYNKCVEALLEDKRTNVERLSIDRTPLFEAVDKGHHETCRLLLDKGADPDNKDNTEPTLVHAVAQGDLETVKVLIEHGKPSAESRTSALLSAVRSSNVDMVRYLVQSGADCNGKSPSGLMIHEAASAKNVAILDALVEAGAKVDDVNDAGQTPLHWAYNDVAMTKRLIEIGCKTSIVRPDDGFTPLHLAIDRWEWEVAKTILQEGHPELELKTNSSELLAGFTPLALAVWRDHAEMTRLLLEAGADPNSKTEKGGAVILQLSVEEDVVRAVLDYDPDLRLQNDQGNTPLNELVEWSGVTISVIKRLLRQGSDVNQPDKAGLTPLFKTLRKSDMAIVELLVGRGANLDHVSKGEGTILHAACWRGRFEAFEFFLQEKGFTDAPYHRVGTLINAACMRTDGDEGPTLSILNTLRESDNWDEVKLDQICGLFGSALSAACFCSTENVVAWLLSNGAKANIRDGYHRYPIHFAAYRDESTFRMLCNAGANIEIEDKIGRTVLHTAAQGGSYSMVKWVLKHQRHLLKKPDHDGWLPLHYAIRGVENYLRVRREAVDQQHEIVQLLINELDDEGACCESKFKDFGHKDEEWSILKFARFYGASAETRKILKKILRERNGPRWDEKPHETREGSNTTYNCDYCFTYIKGFIFHCRTCYDIDFCSKCYGSKEVIHEAHEWEKIGQEFVDSDSSWADEDEDNDDETTGNSEEHSDESDSDDSSSSDDS